MLQSLILSLFLYFPEDKSEYIPAAISFAIFFIACIFTMRFIIKISKREAEKAKELEEHIKQNQTSQKNS